MFYECVALKYRYYNNIKLSNLVAKHQQHQTGIHQLNIATDRRQHNSNELSTFPGPRIQFYIPS